MLKITQIYLKNFRVFKDLSFPIKPITILTGPNSSGKSSIVKALLLLQDNLEKYHLGQLDFSNDTHRLGSFESVKTRGSEQDTLDFGLEYEMTNQLGFEDHKFRLDTQYIANPNDSLKGIIRKFSVTYLQNNKTVLLAELLEDNKYRLQIPLGIFGTNLVERGALTLRPSMNLVRDSISIETFEAHFANLKLQYEEELEAEIAAIEANSEQLLLENEEIADIESQKEKRQTEYDTKIQGVYKGITVPKIALEEQIKTQSADIIAKQSAILKAQGIKDDALALLEKQYQNDYKQQEDAIVKKYDALVRNDSGIAQEKADYEAKMHALFVTELNDGENPESRLSEGLKNKKEHYDTLENIENKIREPQKAEIEEAQAKKLETFEQESYKTLKAEKEALENEYDTLSHELEEIGQSFSKQIEELNKPINRLEGERDNILAALDEKITEIKAKIDKQAGEEKENAEKAKDTKIANLVPGIYHSKIYSQINDYSKNLFLHLTDWEYQFDSIDKSSDLMAFLMSDEWIGQLHNSEINSLTIGDILQDIPELDFLNNDAVWSLKLGEILKDGAFNQITTALISEIRVFIDPLLSQIPFTYTSGIRGLQQRFYNTAGIFDLDKSISQLLELQNQNATTKLEFINEWLKEFEIGKTIRAEQIDGSYIDAKIDGTVSIADMGLGMSQLLPIIITTAYYLDQNYLIVIEEPESHLHPKLQSKLADFMVAANKKGVQFMVETHSVHFIRMIEDFIANHQSNNQNDGTKLDPNDFQMCYFNSNIEGHYTVMPIGENGDILEHNKADLEEFYDPRERRRAKKEVTEQKETINKLKLELEQLRLKKCLLLTEDDDINLLKKILTHSGFNLDEVHFISYEGCCKIDATRVVAQFVNEQFPEKSPYIVVHRDRDYLTDEEVCKEEEKFKACNVTLFITKGTDIEWYLLSAEHIHKCHSKISINLAEDLIKKAAGFKFEEAKHRLFLKEYGDKYKNKSCHGKERLEELIKNDKRYWYGKGVYGYLKQLIKNECKDNAKLEQLTNAIQIPELIQIAQQIWGKSPQNP